MRRTALLLMCVAATGCERKLEAPEMRLDAVVNPRQPDARPAAVCNAQGGTTGWDLELNGVGLVPVPRDLLTDRPGAGMPVVTLQGPESLELARTSVFWQSPTQLSVDVPTANSTPAHQLPPGDYVVRVFRPETNQEVQLEGGLVVVPPPTVTSATNEGPFVEGQPTPVVITGTGFRAGAVPQVTITKQGSGESFILTDVAVASPTELTAMVPPTVIEGTYDVTVANPEGCSATLPGGLVVSFTSLGRLALEPRFGWQGQNTAVTIFNTYLAPAEKPFTGAPEVVLRAPLKSDPDTLVNIPLRRVAFLDANTITAVVPDCSGLAARPLAQDPDTTEDECQGGIAPGGPYEVRVRDPSGAFGRIPLTQGFEVLQDPAPIITAIAPSAIDTGGLVPPADAPLTVTGSNFGEGARVQLLTQLTGGTIRACTLPTTSATATQLQATVPTSLPADQCTDVDPFGVATTPAAGGFTLAVGQYVVRVQNGTNAAYANYSALIVTNPSLNPALGAQTQVALSTPRADFPLVTATDDVGSTFLYALGGTDGTSLLSSVETAQVTPFGDLGGDCVDTTCTFRVLERTPLGVGGAVARRGASAVTHTVRDANGRNPSSFVYVIGGQSDTTTLATIERAQVLRVQDAPDLREPTAGTGTTGPAEGVYYYRVSALFSPDFAANPGGESLASDRVPFRSTGAPVALTWSCEPNAVQYHVYRTINAGDRAGSERLLATVDGAGCSGSTTTVSFTDDGSVTPAADAATPLPAGALGTWKEVATLATARTNAAARIVGNRLYVLGGACSAGSTGCPTGGSTALNSVERFEFGANSPDLTAVGTPVTLNAGRQRFSLTIADRVTAPLSFEANDGSANENEAWLVVVGGDNGATTLTGAGSVEVARVVDNAGASIDTPVFSAASYNGAGGVHGGWAEIVADMLFQAGATGGTGFVFRSAYACPGAGKSAGECTDVASFTGTLNSAGNDANSAAGTFYRAGGPRYLGGQTLLRAFVYVAGGFPSDAGGTPASSIERIIY